MRSSENPLEDLDGTLASHNSCFTVLVTEILDGVYHFFLEHPYEIFQNIIGLV